VKSTGVLRRIDDLGRIVIPKEIRKNLKIRNRELLEIFIDGDNIILSKHSIINTINEFAQLCADSINDIVDANIIITDRDKIIAVSGALKKKYLGEPISDNISNIILNRESYNEQNDKVFKITNNKEETAKYITATIIGDGDPLGVVIFMSFDRAFTEADERMANLITRLLSKRVE
jgi:AbrB family transcriptional regulator (stage V sporulation protein T)